LDLMVCSGLGRWCSSSLCLFNPPNLICLCKFYVLCLQVVWQNSKQAVLKIPSSKEMEKQHYKDPRFLPHSLTILLPLPGLRSPLAHFLSWEIALANAGQDKIQGESSGTHLRRVSIHNLH
jgi:hypothetical protein